MTIPVSLGFVIVIFSESHRSKPQPFVKADGRRIGLANLQKPRPFVMVQQFFEQSASHSAAAQGGLHGQVQNLVLSRGGDA